MGEQTSNNPKIQFFSPVKECSNVNIAKWRAKKDDDDDFLFIQKRKNKFSREGNRLSIKARPISPPTPTLPSSDITTRTDSLKTGGGGDKMVSDWTGPVLHFTLKLLRCVRSPPPGAGQFHPKSIKLGF